MRILLPAGFAPPLTQQKLATYLTGINRLPAALKSPLKKLHGMAVKVLAANWPDRPGEPHMSGRGIDAKLTAAELLPLQNDIPSREEIEAMKVQFETITETETRDMAFHLLWYAIELNIGRIPITTDKI